MSRQLPNCSRFVADRVGYRVWKRLFRHAGKRRAFEAIEPAIRALAPKIRNQTATASAVQVSDSLVSRRRKLIAAFDEIREAQDGDVARGIADDQGGFICGATGLSLNALFSGACLIRSMVAKRNFDLHLISCVAVLSSIDIDSVQNLHDRLRVRPTWYLRSDRSGNILLCGTSPDADTTHPDPE